MAKRICDFCLEEKKGLINPIKKLPDDHCICKDCKKKIENSGLPVKYGIFQLLVTAEEDYRPMIMRDYLQNHDANQILATEYPLGSMELHEGERLVNQYPATITVDPSRFSKNKVPSKITDITKKSILNLCDEANGKEVKGTLYETNAALYFLCDSFINCHRLSTMDLESNDPDAIHVVDHGAYFTYRINHAELFRLRSSFHQRLIAAKEKKKNKLIYLNSENTMTLTSGVYSVPKNLKSGTYYVSPKENASMSLTDAEGKLHRVRNGKIKIAEGSTVEVTGEYRFRLHEKKD